MEQRKEIVNRYVQGGLTVRVATQVAGIPKSTYYYQPNGKRKGKSPSTHTIYNGTEVPNEVVIAEMESILGVEFIDYGYRRMAKVLKKKSFVINKKKVYPLMKKNGLLSERRVASKSIQRSFIRFKTPPYIHPFATIEIDIKYVYLYDQRRNAYLITALDTFTRMAIVWDVDVTMKSDQICDLLIRLKNHPLLQPYIKNALIVIRTDNGPQFIAHALAEALSKLGLKHEFIHPGTPEENAHIEAFHSTVQKLVTSKYIITDLESARSVFTSFYHIYNNVRVMEEILFCSPVEFLKEWENGNVAIGKQRNKQKFFFRERQATSGPALSREDFTRVH